MSSSHFYKLDTPATITHTLNLLSLYYCSTKAILNITREHHVDTKTYKENSETVVPANRLLQTHRAIVLDDKRVTGAFVSFINVNCNIAFTAAMPVINRNMITDMIDDNLVVDISDVYQMLEIVRTRDDREESLSAVYQFNIPKEAVVTYFAHIALLEPSIIRAYYIRVSNRVVFEIDGHLMSLSCGGLTDQAAISFDVHLGFQKATPYSHSRNPQDKDIVTQCSMDFADWVACGLPLEETPLKWQV